MEESPGCNDMYFACGMSGGKGLPGPADVKASELTNDLIKEKEQEIENARK